MIPTIDKRKTGIQLRKIMDSRGLSARKVQQYLDLGSVQSVYHWLNGISIPTIDNLYALSELFHVTIDEIICGNRSESVSVMKGGNSRRLRAYYECIGRLRVA